MRQTKLKAFDPQKGKDIVVGDLINGTLYKKVDSRKHFMRVVQGYGIQESAFRKLREQDIKNLVIEETDTGRKWHTSLDDWAVKGKVADYGAGKQIFLSTVHMESGKDKQDKLL